MPTVTSPLEKAILRLILQHGSMSRARLQELSGVRKMTVYAASDELVRRGLLREGEERRLPRGRPERPLMIPTDAFPVAGVLVRHDRVEATRVNLVGEAHHAKPVTRMLTTRTSVEAAVREVLAEVCHSGTLAIGLAAAGFLDTASGTLLAATPASRGRLDGCGPREVSLAKVVREAGVPVILQNDLHAMAARWVLTERLCREPAEDLLMVFLDDGKVGAAMLIGGRPNSGCVGGANELGHTRLAVETEACYCGSDSGCIERIFSTAFLARHARGGRGKLSMPDLLQSLSDPAVDTKALRRLVSLTGTGISNAVNLTRAGRLLLTGPGVHADASFDRIVAAVRQQTLGTIESRQRIERWIADDAQSARTAGCLAIAHLLLDGWAAGET